MSNGRVGMLRGVDSFFSQLALIEAAYEHSAFAYASVRTKDGFGLLKGAVFLSAEPLAIPFSHFSSKNVRAGVYTLAELGTTPRALVEEALSGKIDSPAGPLLFRPRRDGTRTAVYEPFHALGSQNQQRYDALALRGGELPRFRHQPIDWELKAHEEPFYNLAELLAYYGLGQLDPAHNEQTLEVIAFGVALIDRTSRVEGTRATVGLRLARGLSPNKLRLGYRIVPPSGQVVRGAISGGDLDWGEAGPVYQSEATLDVPAASLVDCTVSYDGYARHHWWVTDPSRAQNPRRAAYEAVDPDLKTFSDYITKTGKTSRDQHDFESAVAWLVWMLGFSPAHLGGSKQLEAADLVVTTPSGHFAVVECTMGLLKSEHKLARLIERTEAIRSRVEASRRVLPVMVTSKARVELRAELPDAEKLGVLVVAREDLDDAVSRTIMMPDADAAYEEAEAVVAAALARHEVQQELELDD